MRFHVFARGHEKRRMLLTVTDEEMLSERIQRELPNRRPEWGRRPLVVLEYGGPGSWTFDWDTRKLIECP